MQFDIAAIAAAKAAKSEKGNKLRDIKSRVPREFRQTMQAELYDSITAISLFQTILSCDTIDQDARKICFMTATRLESLPSVTLFYNQEEKKLPGPKDSNLISMSPHEYRAAFAYTCKVMQFLSLEESFEAKSLPYFVLPAVQSGIAAIDWTEVLATLDRPPLERMGSCVWDAGKMDRVAYKGGQYWQEPPFIAKRFHSDIGIDWDPKVPEVPEVIIVGHDDIPPIDLKRFIRSGKQAVVTKEMPMLELQSIPKQNNLLHKDVKMQISKSCAPGFYCFWGAMSSSFLLAVRQLPSILHVYSRLSLAREFNREVLGNAISNDTLLMQALTTPAAQAKDNYEILEFFGDCVLKFVATCWVYTRSDVFCEGDLHVRRMIEINNNHLKNIAERYDIAEYAFTTTFIPRRWFPHGFKEIKTAVPMSDKMLADLVEALLGAALLGGGMEEVFAVFNALRIFQTHLGSSLSGDGGSLEYRLSQVGLTERFQGRVDLDAFRMMQEQNVKSRAAPQNSALTEVSLDWEALGKLEELVEYKFNDSSLAKEAFTHRTISENRSYERLEFLGDAILDLLIVGCLREMWSTTQNEGVFTRLKSDAVNNDSFGVIALELGLHKHLRHKINGFDERVARFSEQVKRKEDAVKGQSYCPPFWKDKDNTDLGAPKQIADCLESLVGAIFIDANFDLKPAQQVFDKLLKGHFVRFFHPLAQTDLAS